MFLREEIHEKFPSEDFFSPTRSAEGAWKQLGLFTRLLVQLHQFYWLYQTSNKKKKNKSSPLTFLVTVWLHKIIGGGGFNLLFITIKTG